MPASTDHMQKLCKSPRGFTKGVRVTFAVDTLEVKQKMN